MLIIKFGLIVFMCIGGMAFWILVFLASFIPGWIAIDITEKIQEKKNTDKDPFAGRY